MMQSTKIQSTKCSWEKISKSITQVEDPIYSHPVAVEIYQEMYGEILRTLDGEYDDSKVSFYFEISPVNNQ